MPFFNIFASPRWSPLRMRTKVVVCSSFPAINTHTQSLLVEVVANRLRRRTSDQTVLGSNPAVAVALSPWTRLFTPIVPRRSLHTSFYKLSGHPCKIYTGKKKKVTLFPAQSSDLPSAIESEENWAHMDGGKQYVALHQSTTIVR